MRLTESQLRRIIREEMLSSIMDMPSVFEQKHMSFNSGKRKGERADISGNTWRAPSGSELEGNKEMASAHGNAVRDRNVKDYIDLRITGLSHDEAINSMVDSFAHTLPRHVDADELLKDMHAQFSAATAGKPDRLVRVAYGVKAEFFGGNSDQRSSTYINNLPTDIRKTAQRTMHRGGYVDVYHD